MLILRTIDAFWVSALLRLSDTSTTAHIVLVPSIPSPSLQYLLAGDNQNHGTRQNVSLSHLGFVEITQSSRSALVPWSVSPSPACSGCLSLLDLSWGSAIDQAARRRAQAITVLVTPCCGPAEEGLSRELSCVLAASYLGLVAVQLWQAAANGNHEHP